MYDVDSVEAVVLYECRLRPGEVRDFEDLEALSLRLWSIVASWCPDDTLCAGSDDLFGKRASDGEVFWPVGPLGNEEKERLER